MKLRYIVLFLLLFVFMLFTNCSYASMSTDTKNTIYSQCQTLYDKGLISSNTLTYINTKLFNTNTFNGTNYGNDYFILIAKGTRYNGGNYRYSKLSTNLSIYIGCCKTGASSIVNYTEATNNSLYTNWSTNSVFSGFRCNVLNNSDYQEGNFGYNDALDGFYIYSTLPVNTRLITLGAGEEYGGSYLVYHGPVFTPSNNTINVYNNNVLVEVANRLPFGYVFPNTSTLGYLSDYNDTFYGLDVTMSVVNAIDNGTFFSDKLASLNYNLYLGTRSDGLQFDLSTGKLSVTSTLLIPNQLYFLTIYYKNTQSDDWLYVGDKDFSFYSYFYTTSPTSGDAISPDLVHTIDADLINTMKEIGENNPNYGYIVNNSINFSSGDIVNNGFPSGELVSGDFLGINYRDYDDFGFGDFVYRFFYGLYYVLTDYNNVSIDFGILGVINSSQFVISEPFLANFVSLFTNAFLIIVLIWFYYYFYKHISILDLEKVFKYDIDNLFDLF